MTTQIQRRRGTTAQHSTFTGAVGEVTVDTDKEVLVVHDGAQVGGYPQMRENGSNSALALGSAGTPSLKFAGDPNTGIYSPGADQLAISTGGSERLRITSAGLVGIGTSAPEALLHLRTSAPCAILETTRNFTVNRNFAFAVDQYAEGVFTVTPSTALGGTTFTTPALAVTGTGRVGIGTTSPGALLHLAGNADQRFTNTTNTSGFDIGLLGGTGSADAYVYNRANAAVIFGTNNQTRAAIDSSGRLLVGTSSARSNFFNTSTVTAGIQAESTGEGSIVAAIRNVNDATTVPVYLLAKSRGTSVGSNTIVQSQDHLGYLSFQGSDGSEFVEAARISGEVDGTPGANDMPGRLVFSTCPDSGSSPVERVRITNAGRFNVVSTEAGIFAETTQGAGTSFVLFQGRHSATAGSVLSGTSSFQVFSNGNVQNTNNSYGAISDAKLKENIVDATSQWSDIKALQVRKYNFKEGQTHTQIGLVAQEVELVSPGLVSESPDRDAEGNDLGTVTKSVNYSVLYMKAVKALQEAMERIEQLESEMAEVKAQLS